MNCFFFFPTHCEALSPLLNCESEDKCVSAGVEVSGSGMADSVSFQDPAAGRRVLRHERIASWNNGIKVISVSSALLS